MKFIQGSGWEQLLFITIDQSVGLLWPTPQFGYFVYMTLSNLLYCKTSSLPIREHWEHDFNSADTIILFQYYNA